MSPLNQSKISTFLDELELSSGHQCTYPDAVSLILERAWIENKTKIFDDLIFHAKFIVKTREVMNRIGQKAEGYEKLASEIQTSVDYAIKLIRILIESTEQKEEFEKQFFLIETESFSRFIKLLSDLSLIKNWQIDGKPLPYQTTSGIISVTEINESQQTKEGQQNYQSTTSLSHIQKSALLAVILIVLLLLIDPPVTILGWILSLGITVLLAYIIIQILFLTRNRNSH